MECRHFTVLYFALSLLTTATAALDPASYKTGDFVISYDPSSLPTLKITQHDLLVWYTSTNVSNKNFVSAAKVNETVLQIGGNYIFPDVPPEDVCKDFTITKMGTKESPGSPSTIVYMQGSLCSKVPFVVQFEAVVVGDENVSQLTFSVSMGRNNYYNQIRLTYGCDKDEQFYGFGAQYSRFNMKGSRLPIFLSEQGVGRGLEPFTSIINSLSPGAGGTWYTTYTYVPQYVTNYNRSLMLESMEYTVFDMTVNDTLTIEVNGYTLYGRIITGSSILDLITSYTAFVGRLKPLPSWIGQGAVLGLQGGTDAVQKTIQQVATQWGNLSDVAGVWLQDWTGQRVFEGPNELPRVGLWWNWEVDSTHYPNWTELISSLLSKGIRTMTYINPLFSNITQRGTPYNHSYLDEGLKNGYFIKNGDGSVWKGYGNSSMADLSQEKVYEWMVNMIVENMLKTGVCGWMCDFGESVPLDYHSTLPPGELPGPNYHSLYPMLWGKLNADAIDSARHQIKSSDSLCKAEDVVYFMRSGSTLSPSVTSTFWLGDQMVLWDSFDGLGTVVIGMLTEGLSGFSTTHSDIGGYTSIDQKPFQYVRTKELFIRWCELAAFTTIYRSHLGTLPQKNWQFNSDNETLQHFFRMAVVFQSWGFYREQLMEEAHKKGWPVARHMMLVFPHNPKVFELSEELKYQFMLGTELLVAPVLQAFGTTGLVPFARVFLPADTTWIHVWTSTVYQGNDEFISVPTQQGKPCVLYVKDSKVGEQFVKNLHDRNIL